MGMENQSLADTVNMGRPPLQQRHKKRRLEPKNNVVQ